MSIPKLSVVVISYNMVRELPRTLRTLSPAMQRGIPDIAYEVIVVDNGSQQPFPEGECRKWVPDLILHRMNDPAPSPAAAINVGLEIARAGLVGVFIDGARMASPGLLHTALEASKLHDRPVIGALSFHLGGEVQMKSILSGYDQRAEDELLRSSGWEEDGYRLFEVSVFAGSSAKGWFVIPAETNALFLRAEHWRELGGFDTAFRQPGGGLVNLDMWARACADPRGKVILLLGEATFHQIHGGIATNSRESKLKVFHDEYVRIRGRAFQPPGGTALHIGRPNIPALPSLAASLTAFEQYAESFE